MTAGRWGAVAAALICGAGFASIGGRGSAAVPRGGYAGTQRCFPCHIDYARQWAQLDHSKRLMRAGKGGPTSGCEACHGPGARHAARREWRREIFWLKDATPAQQTAVCLRCHPKHVTPAQWRTSPHSKLGVSCLYCHEVHRPTGYAGNLQKPEADLCGGCHGDVVGAARAGKHHALPEGLACTGCHNPHSAAQPALLRAEPKVLCRKCHAPDGPRLRPASHRDEAWARGHGRTAKTSAAKCDTCHTREQFCNACHGVEMPHPEGWAMQHGAAALKGPDTCARCHDEKKCSTCHEQMAPSSHREETFRKKHGAVAKGQEALCNLCHGQDSCNKCHGTPIPHPENWMMEHKGKGASLAEGSLCFKCHKKEEFCGRCHPGS